MALTNAERELLWADGWNDLADAMAQLGSGYLVDDEWKEVTADDCRGLIQSAAYASGKCVRFRRTVCKGRPSIQFYFT